MNKAMRVATVLALTSIFTSSAFGFGEISSGARYERDSGNAWINGEYLVRTMQAHFWTQPSSEPVPGNIGTWSLSLHIEGDFLDNPSVSQGDVDFAIANPRRLSGDYSVNRLVYHDDDWGQWIEFDPTFRNHFQATASTWRDVGKGLVGSNQYWSDANVWVSVLGGSITSVSNWVDDYTAIGGEELNMPDWRASIYFSGVVEAETFKLAGISVPEPATIGLLALGAPILVRRRRR